MGYGSVRVRALAELHPKVNNHAGKNTRDPCPPRGVGTLILVSRSSVCPGARGGARDEGIVAVVARAAEGTVPDLDLLWRSYVRRFDLESTLSASSSRAWDGPPLGFATPSRRIGGVGWWWPPTRS
jgi:hypothetical protein